MNDLNQADLEPVADDTDDYSEFLDQETDDLDDAVESLADDEDDVETDDEAEAEEEVVEDDDQPDEDEAADSDDSVKVSLEDGEEVTLKELKAGYFRQKDYTHKTTEIAEQRKATEAVQAHYETQSKFVESTLQNLSSYLQGLIPAEPSLQLAQSDPGAYQYQKALRESAISELGQLGQMQDGVAANKQEVSQADMQRYRDAEAAKLVKVLPHLSDPSRRAAFDAANQKAAMDFGFTQDEIAQTADSRILQLVHFARIGKLAETNRNNAKRRVETPKSGKAKPPTVSINSSNRQGMQRLSKSGSINDAMNIDFD